MKLIALLTNYCLDKTLIIISYDTQSRKRVKLRVWNIPNIAHQGIDYIGMVMLIDGCNNQILAGWGALILGGLNNICPLYI